MSEHKWQRVIFFNEKSAMLLSIEMDVMDQIPGMIQNEVVAGYRLRNHDTRKYLTVADLNPDCDDADNDSIINMDLDIARYSKEDYENDYKNYGFNVTIDIVAFNNLGCELDPHEAITVKIK